MTYNIYHGEQAYEPGKSNLQEVARVINTYKPDFVAIQEVDSLTGRSAELNDCKAQELLKKLGALNEMAGVFGRAMDYDGGGYGEDIVSRHPSTAIPRSEERRVVQECVRTCRSRRSPYQ